MKTKRHKLTKLLLTSRLLKIIASIIVVLLIIYHTIDILNFLNWSFDQNQNFLPISKFSIVEFILGKTVVIAVMICIILITRWLVIISKVFNDLRKNIDNNEITHKLMNRNEIDCGRDKKKSSYQPREIIKLSKRMSKAANVSIFFCFVSGMIPAKHMYDIVQSLFAGNSQYLWIIWLLTILFVTVNIIINCLFFYSLFINLAAILMINMDIEINTRKYSESH